MVTAALLVSSQYPKTPTTTIAGKNSDTKYTMRFSIPTILIALLASAARVACDDNPNTYVEIEKMSEYPCAVGSISLTSPHPLFRHFNLHYSLPIPLRLILLTSTSTSTPY
jgi:hypothetical protein